MEESNGKQVRLAADLSPLGLIAFSLGTAIGWGSLVVTSSTYLSSSGVAGSVIGMILGAAVMIIICRNYSYLMQIYPDAGGAYAYSREILGHDYGFLTAWFLALTYLSVLWANATSIPLFARYFIGPVFQFGKLYTIFSYDIYIGEILLTLAGLLLIALLCSRSKKGAMYAMIALAFVFVGAILVVSFAAITGHRGGFTPAYVPDSGALKQIIYIAVISPWAFIGFESISHGAEEFSFKGRKLFRLMVISVVITAALYILVTLLSVTAYPPQYGSWLEYIRDRGNLDGIEALPAFYAAQYYLGSAGVGLLMLALMGLIITSLIGNTTALSRLFMALGRDKVLPERYSEINGRGVPGRAVALIAVISLVIPFVGRTAIGWIVDVTTIGATLIYGLISASTMLKAKRRADRIEYATGVAGLVIMIGYGLYTLVPNLVSAGTIERETYFLFIVWSILGFIYFRALLRRDKEKKYGSSVIVWVSLMSLVLFISLIWMRQSMIASNARMMNNINQYYEQFDDADRLADEEYIREQIREMEDDDARAILMGIGMFAFALIIMFSNHSYMNRRTRESEMIANIDPLTGVKSKHAYLVRTKEVDARISSGGAEPFSVVVCDVNGLKYINDTQGHKAGDEYICAASRMICEIYQHSPVFRLGGDEFAIILTGHDNDVGGELLQMLHNRSADNISLGRVVVSGGMAVYDPACDADFHSVFERADELMYKEKMLLKSLGAITRDGGPELGGEEESDNEFIRERVSKNLELAEDEGGIKVNVREDLTNLYKKEYFWQGVAAYDELYANTPMDAVMIDINHFHMINERFGRSFGDDVLRHVGISVQNYAKKAGGIACRRSADEFEIYCPHRDDYSDIVDSVKSDSDAGRIASARLRIGVYENVDKSLRVGQRFDRAKMAADNVKTGHINNIGYYDDGMYEAAISNEELLEDFLVAIENREFEVYMQPKYDIRGDKPVLAGAEALARWNHPRLGMLLPSDFVPVLEENGRIFELDRFIWRETASIVREWKDKYGFDLPISVNVSRIDMTSTKIRDVFIEILETYRLTSEDIVLEITESAYTDTQMLITVARELHSSDPGFKIEMDDFGSGYSTLGMLTELPIDAFKLDMSLVGKVTECDRGRFSVTKSDEHKNVTRDNVTRDGSLSQNPTNCDKGRFSVTKSDEHRSTGAGDDLNTDSISDRSMKMIELVIAFAKSLDISVVAEGVETEEQLRLLKDLGCDYVQGFILSEPLPAAEFAALIR